MKDLGIVFDPVDYSETAIGKERVVIDKYTTSISKYKSQREIEIAPDAVNLAYIQKLRKNQGQSFRALKEFFLTSDKHLINWELKKLDKYPIAMYPSNWLSIILKFGSRTTDDYKSFVSFIKNVHHEEPKDPDTVLATLKVISQKAESIEKEKALFDIFIENDYEEATSFNTFSEKEQYAEVKIQEYIDKRMEEYEKKEKENHARIVEMENKQKQIEQKEQERVTKERLQRITVIDAQYDGIKAQRDNTKLLYGIVFVASIILMYLIWKDFNWLIDDKGELVIKTSSDSLAWIFFLSSIDLGVITTSIVKFKNAISKKTLRSELLTKEVSPSEIEDLYKRIS